jgi:hypothetical protein
VKILRDQVILEKLDKANDDFAVQLEIIENQISIENQILVKQKEEALNNVKNLQNEKGRVEEEKKIALTEIEIKKNELNVKSEEMIVFKNTHEIQSLKQQLDHKKQWLEITNRNIESYKKRHIPIAAIIEEKLKNHKFYLALILIIFFAFIVFLIYKLTWNTMEPYTYILSPLAILAEYLYFAIKGENIDPRKYFEYYENGVTSKIYSEFDFNIADLQLQKDTKKSLEEEIIGLEKKIQKNTHSA